MSLTSRSVQGRGAQRSVHRDLRGPGAPRWRQEPLQGQRSDHRLHRVKAELWELETEFFLSELAAVRQRVAFLVNNSLICFNSVLATANPAKC